MKNFFRLAGKLEGDLEIELNETKEKIIYISTQISIFEGKIISLFRIQNENKNK